MHSIDEGHKALQKVIYSVDRCKLLDGNEAETRLKVIDEVLFSVLGWDKDDIFVESRVSEDGKTEFADYIIKTAFTSILVEAKRIGAQFTLPGKYTKLKLNGVLSQGQVGEAIKQARDYCRKKSIPYAVVTNGDAWIIFPAVRTDGIEFSNSEAILFHSLDDVVTRLIPFWELISKERVLDGNLESELLGKKNEDPQDRCLRHQLPEPGFRLGRNSVYEYIEPAVSKSLSDEALLNNEEALEICYVKTSERLKFDSRIQMHLLDPVPPIGRPVTRLKSRKQQDKFEEAVKKSSLTDPSKFIVLLGPVGAGKTTFLNYTRKISAKKLIDNKIIWLNIDYKLATPNDNPRLFLYSALLSLIEDDREFKLGVWETSIWPAYQEIIDNLSKGPLYLISKSKPDEFQSKISDLIFREREAIYPYVERILKFASSSRPAYIIIDNVDQLEDPDYQAAIFLEAQALARKIGFNIIISLRESTYLAHRDRPTFDAFQFDTYYIDPPSVLPVLSHRFAYAKKTLAGKRGELKTEKGMTVIVNDLSCFFDLVSSSILDEQSGYMLECLSGGDTRRGLHLVREFLASGHTNADRAIAAYLADGAYKFPKHEVFKGAVLGSLKYYNDKHSLVLNLFDSKLPTRTFQLLRLKIIEILVNKFRHDSVEGIAFSELYSSLLRLGISEFDLSNCLMTLYQKRFIRTNDGLPVRPDSVIAPTRFAGYSLQYLCSEFTYTEMCCIDTIIFDDDSWNKMLALTKDIESRHNIVERLKLRQQRMEEYLNYLLITEEKWTIEGTRYGMQSEWINPTISTIIKPSIEENIKKAIKSAEKASR